MQPYFFPYIGYWQLINAVDKYVIADDVNYIKGGWIHRNRILNHDHIQYLGLHISHASQNCLIYEVEIFPDPNHFRDMIRTIEWQYKRAPYFDTVFPKICAMINYEEKNLARYLEHQIKSISSYLGIETEFLICSEIPHNRQLKCQERVIDSCQVLGATEYINAVGGQLLYSRNDFAECGIDLKFLQTEDIRYHQFNDPFAPNLSIIDVFMFNSKEEVQQMLEQYQLF